MTRPPFHEDFPFRAQRTYVHSTSLCNFLAARFPDCSRFEIVLKQWMDSRVVFTPVEAVRPGQGCGYAKLTTADGAEAVYELSEDKNFPVSTREPYDEDAVAEAAALDGQSLTLPAAASGDGSSFFDRLIAANKLLINRCLDPGVKLIAAKVATPGFPSAGTAFTLQLASHAGTRIFKSRLLIGGEACGEVIFYGQ